MKHIISHLSNFLCFSVLRLFCPYFQAYCGHVLKNLGDHLGMSMYIFLITLSAYLSFIIHDSIESYRLTESFKCGFRNFNALELEQNQEVPKGKLLPGPTSPNGLLLTQQWMNYLTNITLHLYSNTLTPWRSHKFQIF